MGDTMTFTAETARGNVLIILLFNKIIIFLISSVRISLFVF